MADAVEVGLAHAVACVLTQEVAARKLVGWSGERLTGTDAFAHTDSRHADYCIIGGVIGAEPAKVVGLQRTKANGQPYVFWA